MGRKFHVNQDVAAGLMFIVIGAAGLWLGRDYPAGTALRMGPGYLPLSLSWLLVAFGAGIGITGGLEPGEKLTGWALRPLALVVLGTLAFGLLIETLGLVIAAMATTLIGALGGREFKLGEQMTLAVVLAAASALIFVYGLGLPMDMWPRW